MRGGAAAPALLRGVVRLEGAGRPREELPGIIRLVVASRPGFAPEEQAAARAEFAAWSERLIAAPPSSDCAADALAPEGQWTAYLQALSGFISGDELERISARDYAAYDVASTNRNWRLPAGYGTLIAAAPDPKAALAVVDEAVAAMDAQVSCLFCQVMIAVPAAVACIEGDRLDEAREWLAQAERSAAAWQGTAWQGAVAEARAHLARAEGDDAAADRLFGTAADLFSLAGQPIDVQRCLEAVPD